MIKHLFVSALAASAVGFAFVGTASAQTFPADEKFAPLPCGSGTMSDGHRDQTGALRERDIVGDTLAPAGFRASDGQYLYLRLRLDDNPAPGGTLRPYGWGFLLGTDATRNNYEVLIIVSGTTGNVAVHTNKTTTTVDDATDPADEPPVATFPFSTHGRTRIAPASQYGGDPDYLLDIAVPWATLEPLGAGRLTPLNVWAATSSNANRLDADFACHDGASGPPRLSTITPPQTALDPNVDSDGDGWSDAVEISSGTNPNSAASKPSGTPPPLSGGATDPVLAGAGGCAYGATGPSGFLLALALTGWLARRRRA